MMKRPAITIGAAILVSALGAGLAWAQSPRIIQNTRDTMNGVSSQKAAASNQALGVHESAPSAAAATHPAKKPAPAAMKASSAAPAHAHSVEARKEHHQHWRRGGAVLVGQSVQGDPAAAHPEEQPVDGATRADATPGSAEGGSAASDDVVPDSKYAANGRRDPFISPVVSHAGGSGCSTGKKCLEIGAINLRGVVHAESGFIAVVSNGMNKAYFLRENDPVFNGYVVKITGDSVVFQETVQDRLGKSFTREVVKKITAPAV
ncbi:MAG: hypothetical protein WBQ43_07950 [Terriglobales bacterium]